MREFIGIFLACLVICYAAMLFFGGLFLDNIWGIVTVFSFVLAVFITLFIKQESRIEELEKKVDTLLHDKPE
ncbi:hypothetical protein AB1K89_13145 [Sporosarcina sp. 179-K 8C2 HS]|uniref:hypothetical protein n=1 Tax=Sporosarcina sp. 179-K 8C2 HS TaxID=3142387 RepID=UPI0039A1B9B9